VHARDGGKSSKIVTGCILYGVEVKICSPMFQYLFPENKWWYNLKTV
jgi:hypothetical protein